MLKKFLELFKRRVLPALPEEYDKIYYVDSSTVKPAILHRSGYKIFHRPYFAMKNSTHGIWQLNPHKNTGAIPYRAGCRKDY